MVIQSRTWVLFFLIAALIQGTQLFGQKASKKGTSINTDSLIREAKLLIGTENNSKAALPLDQLLSIANDRNEPFWKLTGYYLYGNMYAFTKDYTTALNYYSNALSIALKMKDDENQLIILEKLVDALVKLREFKDAENRCIQLIEVYKKVNNPYGAANAYSKLGSIYFDLKDMDNAQKALDNASLIFKQIKKDDIKRLGDEPVAKMALEEGDSDNEAENQAQSANKKANTKAAASLKQIASVYKQMGNFSEAKKNFEYSYKIYSQEENYHEMAACLVSISDVLLNSKDYKKALLKYFEALKLSETQNLKISRMESYKGISLCLGLLNDYKRAFTYYQKYVAERDLIYAEEKEDEIMKMRSQLELENKHIQIRLLRKENEIDQLEIEKKNIWLVALTLMVLLLLVAASLLYSRYRLKKRLNDLLSARNNDLERIIVDLKESETNLSTLNTTKDKFFSIISHDIKAPLNSLKGYLNLAKDFPEKISSKEIKEFAHVMDVSVSNLSGLLNNLLEWAMVQSGAIQVVPTRIKLVQIIKKQAELFLPQFVDKQIRFVLHSNDELEVWADTNMVAFIIRNIVHNAIKFTNPGGEIKVEILEEPNFVVVKVIDNGIGMEEQVVKNLFNPESRNISHGTRREKGTGLGLMLCKDFVSMNKGEIHVESKIDAGSTFIIKLPLSPSYE